MPRINLLPWRDELRKERQQRFIGLAVGAAAVGAIAVFVARSYTIGLIEYQQQRNQFLKEEIALLDAQIGEIQELETLRDRLLARMNIIEQLQRSRPEIVHLFDELVRTLPEGVHLKRITQTGSRLKIEGVAQSSTRVSALMRNIDGSDWLRDPVLDRVETVEQGRTRNSEFTVFASQVATSRSPDEDELE